jgi:hydrogenase nickel incorporation protein HypA/HybF
MHEYHAVESIVRQVIKEAQANQALRICKIKLVVGKSLGFAEDSLRLYFEAITEGTIAASAALQIEYRGGQDPAMDYGREFYVDSIEVEKADCSD